MANQSTSKRTVKIIENYLEIHGVMKLYHAQRLCEKHLGKRIRRDYLVCSLMGRNCFIDCDNYMIYKGQ